MTTTSTPMTQATIYERSETFLCTLLAELGSAARAQRFEVAPNPCVGAAVLSGATVVSRGVHERWGGPHAEIKALDAAAASQGLALPRHGAFPAASGVPAEAWDTLVCTLEPCSTTGKTPPCTDRIIQSGIKRVVVGALDPDPRHRGDGLRILRDAGIEVELVPNASPLDKLAPHFLRWVDPDRVRRPRPWTIAKWAQTRSGHLRPPPQIGSGRWISGPESLDEVHRLRGRVDAIVTGVSTVLADDPRFSVRSPGDPSHPPRRVVLDSYLRTPPTGRMFAAPGPDEGAGPIHILCQAGADGARHRALVAAGAHVTGLHSSVEDHVALRDVQEWLWAHGVRRVLLEAGPLLLSRYLAQGFVDQLRVYTGNVNGGEGEPMGSWMARLRTEARLDREVGPDSVLEAFVTGER